MYMDWYWLVHENGYRFGHMDCHFVGNLYFVGHLHWHGDIFIHLKTHQSWWMLVKTITQVVPSLGRAYRRARDRA